jgi:hypothetical protein
MQVLGPIAITITIQPESEADHTAVSDIDCAAIGAPLDGG